jgi:uncharacterized protein YkwD
MLSLCTLLIFKIYFVSQVANGVLPSPPQEKYPFSKWDQSVIEQCNTAKDVTYLTDQEKEVIFLCNLARWDGKLFSETYLKQYIDSTGAEKNSYVTSLFSDLKKVKKIQPLQPAEDLYKAADAHAVESGKKGSIGHQKVDFRFKKYAPSYNDSAENCDYGNDLAIDIVMSLLIDEDVPNKGHRKNILDKDMTHVGVSIREHKKYDYNCVMDFGKK